MSENRDPSLRRFKDRDDRDHNPDANQILSLDPEGQWKQKHFLIGINNSESHQEAKNTSRGTHGFGARVHPQKMGVGDGDCHQSRAHNAERVALYESSWPPIALQVGANKPEGEHVEKNVTEVGMEQRISNQLPHLAMHHLNR